MKKKCQISHPTSPTLPRYYLSYWGPPMIGEDVSFLPSFSSPSRIYQKVNSSMREEGGRRGVRIQTGERNTHKSSLFFFFFLS